MHHYFLHVPQGVVLEKCDVIVFCHGFLGNWLLYPQIFGKYSKDIVICVGTPNLSGIFTYTNMNDILNIVVTHAYKRIGILNKKAHLVGLSNGSSAINVAIKSFPNQYKSYTILSGLLSQTPQSNKKINVINGANDRSVNISSSIPKNRYRFFIIPNENHGLLISNPDTVFSILNSI